MRYFILFVLPALLALGCVVWGVSIWLNTKKPGPAALNASPRALRSASDAIRALDQILTDPTLIASTKWREEATKTVNDWYNKG